MSNTYVIDGNNVCGWSMQSNNNKVYSVAPLLAVMIAILENNDRFYCIFDASILHSLKDSGNIHEANYLNKLMSEFPAQFYTVTGSSRADGAIVHDANSHNRRIISNDLFKDYRNRYSWLGDKFTERLIQGNLQPNGLLTIDKLTYGHINLIDDFKLSSKKLLDLLENPSNKIEGNYQGYNNKTETSQSEKEIRAENEDCRYIHNSESPKNLSVEEYEQVLISKVNKELSVFLEPYDTVMPFKGSSWDAAIKRLKVYFSRHKICIHCYRENYLFSENCVYCGHGNLTKSPERIWEIVNKCAPKDSSYYSFKGEEPIKREKLSRKLDNLINKNQQEALEVEQALRHIEMEKNKRKRHYKIYALITLTVLGILVAIGIGYSNRNSNITNKEKEIKNIEFQITKEKNKIKNIKNKYPIYRFWDKIDPKDKSEIEKSNNKIKELDVKKSKIKNEISTIEKKQNRVREEIGASLVILLMFCMFYFMLFGKLRFKKR